MSNAIEEPPDDPTSALALLAQERARRIAAEAEAATGEDGFLAAFVTGGAGDVMIAAMENVALPLEDLEASLIALPSSSQVRLLIQYPRPDDFVAIAQRGIFACDWTDVHRVRRDYTRKYEKVAAPHTPIKVDELPPLLQMIARRTRFDLSFLREDSIAVRKIFPTNEIITKDPL